MDARGQVIKDVFFMEYENNAVIEVDENNLVVYVKENKIPVTVQVLKETLGLLPADRKGTRCDQRNTKSNWQFLEYTLSTITQPVW